MNTSTVEIMNKGMQCLREKLGVVEAEIFISVIIREKFDYTQWQQEHFDDLTPEQINSETKQYITEHPFNGKTKIIL